MLSSSRTVFKDTEEKYFQFTDICSIYDSPKSTGATWVLATTYM